MRIATICETKQISTCVFSVQITEQVDMENMGSVMQRVTVVTSERVLCLRALRFKPWNTITEIVENRKMTIRLRGNDDFIFDILCDSQSCAGTYQSMFLCADKRSSVTVKDPNVEQENNKKSNWRLDVQPQNVFVLAAEGGGAGRYFKVRCESEAVLGDSERFE